MRILTGADVPCDPNLGAAGTDYCTNVALRELGHEVDEFWSTDLPHKIRHGNLHYLLELPSAYRRAVRERLAKKSYDVVQLDQPHGWLAAKDHARNKRLGIFVGRSQGWEARARAALKPWRKRFGQPEWRFPHGLPGRLVQALLEYHARLLVKHADGILVGCTECRDFILNHYETDDHRVVAVPYAGPSGFCDRPARPLTLERINKVLYVGQFAFFKAPHVLAQVVNRVLQSRREVQFTWVCDERHHAMARMLLSQVARERVRFLPWQDQSSLMDVYDQHGIFVFPSFFEGFGKVFLEAMARGLCVVASRVGGMRDIIDSGNDGYLVEAGDTDGFVSAILGILEDPDRATEIARTAREKAIRFTWRRSAQETVKFYEALQERRARLLSAPD